MNIPKQRRFDRLASNLIFLSLAIWNGINVFVSGGYFYGPAHRQPTIIAAALVLAALKVLLALGIRKGKLWAKLLFTIDCFNGAFSMTKYMLSQEQHDMRAVTQSVLTYGLQLSAVVCCFLFLFTKNTSKI